MTDAAATNIDLSIVLPPEGGFTDHLQPADIDLRAFFALSLDLLCVAGSDGYFKHLNPAWERVLGYRADQLLAVPFLEFVHPDDREATVAETARLLAGNETVRFSNRYQHADGSYRWLSWTASSPAGSELIYAAARDITEERLREQELRASEQRFRTLIQSAPGGILIGDEQGRIVLANRLVEEMFGYDPDELIGRSIDTLVPESMRGAHSGYRDRYHRMPKQRPMGANRDLRGRRRDGSEFPVAIGLAPLPGEDGMLVAATITDITEQQRHERELIHANTQLEERIGELQVIKREAEVISQMVEMLQASQNGDEAHGVIEHFAARLFSPAAGAVSLINGSRNIAEGVVAWGDLEAGDGVFEPAQCWAIRRGKPHVVDGDTHRLTCRHLRNVDPVSSLCIPLLAQGEALGVLTVVSAHDMPTTAGEVSPLHRLATTFADRVALAIANLRLRHSLQVQSIRDPITGLFNRRHLEASMEREIARAIRHQSPVGVIMFDLDHFKRFNDTHGHRAGDAALSTVGDLLLQLVRAEDIPSRYGGEEFAVVLPGATLEQAGDRAEEIRRQLAATRLMYDGRDLGNITVSGGVAGCPDHGFTPDELILAADQALYRAKVMGRNRIVVSEQDQPTADD